MAFVTRTINFGWNQIKEQYLATCRVCGKQYERITSTGYNDMASPEKRAEYRAKLKADAERYSKEPITCNACQKGKIREALPVEMVSLATIGEIATLESEQAELDERKRAVEREISQHRDRLFMHQGETYAQSSCHFGWGGDGFRVHGYCINKRQPWETTNKDTYAPITEITYLDDTLADRKVAIKANG